MAVRQDINVGLLAFVGIVGTMLLAICVWGLEGWYAYEVDLLNTVRYESDQNLGWSTMRDEQYANIGDPVGNDTIYAAADAGEAALGGSDGFRFISREREAAAIPIHAAMAEMVRQHGGTEVSIQEMREADRRHAAIANPLYDNYMTPVLRQAHGRANETPSPNSGAGVGQAPTTQPRESP